MKTRILSIFLFLALCHLPLALSQVPQGFNYQAIATNSAGEQIVSADIILKLGILADSPAGDLLWEEEHSCTTDANGVFSVVFGDPAATKTGGSAASFRAVDWAHQTLYLQTKVNYQGTWHDMGTTRLLSVPYAFLADELSGSVKKLTVSGTTTDVEEPLFEVKNNNNQTVFAVYSEGIRAYVDDGNAKGVKGGFAIGSFDDTKAPFHEYFRITRDSARLYVNKNAKGMKGGFAIGGFDDTKGVDNFLNLTPENYFIGHNAGLHNTTGANNSVIGYESALNNTEGSDNVFIGYQSGYSNTLGLYNVFIGKRAGYSNIGAIQTDPYYLEYGSYNVFIGTDAGFSNESGWTNLFLGNSAGYGNISGSDNTFVGNFSGQSNMDGWGNTTLGDFSGRSNISGVQNVFLGYDAGNKNLQNSNTFVGASSGANNENGSMNTFIGFNAGYNSAGWGNVFIGSGAGSEEPGNGKLYIANSNTATPLIWGDFGLSRVGIHRKAAANAFEVEGTASKTVAGSWLANSDIRIKTDISDIQNACETIMNLHPVKFRYTDEWQSLHPSIENKYYYNFIAQEYAKVFPESVQNGGDKLEGQEDGLLQMDSYNSQIVSVKAIQELILENRELKEELHSLRDELDQIKALLAGSGSR